MTKLLCKQDIEDKMMPTRQEILAILGLRLGLELKAQNRSDADVAKELVERHMRVVMQMAVNSQTIATLAPSEPILAEASIQLMRRLKNLRPAQALHQVLGDSLHAKGERGEFIATLLLLLARDEAEQVKGCAKIPVKTFLEKLMGNKVLKVLPSISKPGKEQTTLEDAFEDAYVHFTHTIVMQKQNKLTKANVWPLIARGALPVCAIGQQGIDLMIPVVQGDMVNASTVTVILIQVKNSTASDLECNDFFHKMDPFYLGFLSTREELKEFEHPFIRIVMAFQGSQSEVKRHHLISSRRNDYTTYDIICRGITHRTYKVVKEKDEEDWKRCLDILGGYKNILSIQMERV
jgi:hypothetical protein